MLLLEPCNQFLFHPKPPKLLEKSGKNFYPDNSSNGEITLLPQETLSIFQEVLEQMGQNRPVVVLPLDTELSTFEAADVLNVSRPFVTKLLERGEMPFRMVGSHHQVLLVDVLKYQEVQRQCSLIAMQELSDLPQELGCTIRNCDFFVLSAICLN